MRDGDGPRVLPPQGHVVTVMGLFDRIYEARQVVRELIDHGFQRDDMSLVSRLDGEYGPERRDNRTSGAAIEAGAGATLGSETAPRWS